MDHLLVGILFYGGAAALLARAFVSSRRSDREQREKMAQVGRDPRTDVLLPLAINDGVHGPSVGGHSDGGHSSGDAGGGDGGGGSDH